MRNTILRCLTASLFTGASFAFAQPVPSGGTLIVLPAEAEVRQQNDEARLILAAEEQDKDQAAAASRVNQKINRGIEILKAMDKKAVLQTQGYYTYPVYAAEQRTSQANRARVPVAWRVGQQLEIRTKELGGLPKMLAAAQEVLGLNSLQFGLSTEAAKGLEEKRIAAAYANLNERIAAVAKAMGKRAADAQIETIDFEGSGNYLPNDQGRQRMAMRASAAESMTVVEPRFEPGETALNTRLVAKFRFR
jgi:uncharacterized protein